MSVVDYFLSNKNDKVLLFIIFIMVVNSFVLTANNEVTEIFLKNLVVFEHYVFLMHVINIAGLNFYRDI